jgi:subtilisin family serine protease
MTYRLVFVAAILGVQACGLGAAFAADDGTTGIIVRLTDPPVTRYRGGIKGLAPTSVEPGRGRRLDARSRAVAAYRAFLGGRQDAFVSAARLAAPEVQVLHRYQLALNGVALRVPATAVDGLRALPGVAAVYPDERRHPTTDSSPGFIGAPAAWKALGGRDSAGEGIIVGVLDTGIWPEHPSFSDPDPDGNPYPTPPVTPACELGIGANPGPPAACNNKLIGAYRFMAAYDACVAANQCTYPAGTFTSARDDNGHGTHTASTAAGNGQVPATILGIPRGIISGIAPRAHVIAYKVCGQENCFQSDSVAAVEQAIADGVDVINFSISGGTAPYFDPVEMAFLAAYAEGIFVAAAAGNEGPNAETVDHRGPWVTSVAASTEKRQFASKLTLASSDGKKLKLAGATITAGLAEPLPVVDAASVGDPFCENATPDGAFADKVAICRRGENARLEKGFNVAQRGAGGMIVYDPTFIQGLFTDNFVLPSLYLSKLGGTALLAFLAQHPAVTATFPTGKAKGGKGDVMAGFSSRGGPLQILGVSKPDITAPGVQILAGNTPDSATLTDADDQLFQAIQGTSMSSPHVAGAAALVRALHPSFSAGQIQSTLMTLANPKVVDDDGATPADPFDVGSGRLSLKKIAAVPVTFEASWVDFVFGYDVLSYLNTPSLYLPSVATTATVQRTAHNVLDKDVTLKLKVEAPDDLVVTVPAAVTVAAGGDATFAIGVDVSAVPEREVRHAAIVFSGGGPKLRFPITVRKISGTTTLYGGLGGGTTPVPGGVATLDQAVGSGSVFTDAVTPGWLTGLDFWFGILVGATNEGGPARLLGIDPDTGGPLGEVTVFDDSFSAVAIGDLAVHPGTGLIYGIRWGGDGAGLAGRLYVIDPGSGFATLVGDVGSCSEGGIAFAPDGTLYFVGYTDCSFTSVALRVLNPETAATISSIPLESGRIYDGLAVRPTDGALFASQSDALYVVDPATGVEVFWGRSETGAVADLAFR